MDAIECIKSRRSIRAYKKTAIERLVIEDIIDCGRLAASANNIQPWHFVVITNPDMLSNIAAIADYGKFIAEAPCCIAVFCEKVKYYLEDGSAATQNILLAARAHGLGSCWVAGDKKEYCPRIAKLLNVPDNLTLISLIAIGEAASTPSPDKKNLGEVLHWEKF